MTPITVLTVQCSFSIMVFYLIAKWYVIPKFSVERRPDILALLLLIHVFRYLPLSLFMPAQVSVEFPHYLKEMVAYGDFISSLLALVALLLIRSKKKAFRYFIWLFSVISISDMLIVLVSAMREKVYLLDLGANYFTISVYVPLLIVSQTLILKLLITKKYR